MSTYTAQRDAIVAVLNGITGIGLVYSRPQVGSVNDLWITDIDGIPVVRAWQIGLAEPVEAHVTAQAFRGIYRPWLILGWAGPISNDDTPITDGYTTLCTLGEQILDAIAADRTLAGTCLDLSAPGAGIVVTQTEPDTFSVPGGPLCWSTQIAFTAWTESTP